MKSQQPLQAASQPVPSTREGASKLLQRKCACGSGGAAGLTGTCDDCRDKRLLGLQTKLEISQPGDSFEQEADLVADAVMRRSAPGAPQSQTAHGIQRQTITPVGATSTAGAVYAPPVVQEVLGSAGQPLDTATRSFMESRFGHDFSRVRVHTDERASQSAEAVRAKAYTMGRDVVFRRGAYAPDSGEGKRLLAHELAHVVQQGGVMNIAPGIGRERNAQGANGSAAPGGGSLKINRASGLRIARQPEGAAAPRGPTVTPEIEARLIEELQNARRALPPSANIPQEANRTFATAAIIKPDGTVTYVTSHFAEGMTEHAEPQLLKKIEGMVKAGDTVAIAIDQVPCDHTRANCQAVLKQFRTNPQRGSLRVYTVRALRKDVPQTVTPETATPRQRVSPKTAIQRPIEGRFLFEEKEFRRVRLPIYKEPPAAPPAPPGAAPVKPAAPTAAAEPPAGAVKPAAGAEPGAAAPKPSSGTKVKPPAPSAPASGGAKPRVPVGQIALGLGKFAGPMILDMINRYTIVKAEAERTQARIVAKIESPEVKARITELVEQKRLEIAAMQHRGREVFATINLQISLTDDVFNKMTLTRIEIEDVNRSKYECTVMSHEPIINSENKVCWAEVSLPLPNVEVSKSEEAQIELEMLEEQGRSPETMHPEALGELSEKRNRLLSELPQIKEKEEQEKKEEIGRPSVIPDQKKRAQQQAEIGEQLRRLNEKKQASAPRQQNAPPQPASPALLPAAPAAPQTSFLPGAAGEGPIAQAAKVVKQAEVWATQLVNKGTALTNRISSGNAPTQAERNAFRDEEAQWRLSVKYAMNDFTAKSRSEAVNALGELLDRFGGKLEELRIRLVG